MTVKKVVGIWCVWQVIWTASKLPWMFDFAKTLRLPHAYTPHPNGVSGGDQALTVAPIMRVRIAQKTPPRWVGFHAICALLMEGVFAMVLFDALPMVRARWLLGALVFLQVPFLLRFHRNLGPVKPFFASCVNLGTTTGTLACLWSLARHPGDQRPFMVMLGIWQFVTVVESGTVARAGMAPWRKSPTLNTSRSSDREERRGRPRSCPWASLAPR
jgi:hypothetical protein